MIHQLGNQSSLRRIALNWNHHSSVPRHWTATRRSLQNLRRP
jgi:hypothetical protein